MYKKKEYKTLRLVSNVTSGFGWVIVALLFILGWVVGSQSVGGLAGFFSGLVFGITAGIPIIVSGQLISVFMDQKELLEEILVAVKPGTSSG